MKIIKKIVYDNTDPVEEITIDPNSVCTIERRVTRQSAYSVRRDFDSEESYEEESYEYRGSSTCDFHDCLRVRKERRTYNIYRRDNGGTGISG